MGMTWLVADLGGTNARFALAHPGGTIESEDTIPTATSTTLGGLVREYMRRIGGEPPDRACVACAGPVVGDRVRLTNADVQFSVEETRVGLGLQTLQIVNDFAAVARALPALPSSDLVPLGGGAPRHAAPAPMLAIGPGTGLGVATVVPAAGRWTVLPGEGGHVALCGLYDDELDIIRHLRGRAGFVSAEMLVSGPGLSRLYLHHATRDGAQRPRLDPVVSRPDQIVDRALRGEDRTSVEALNMFCRLLGVVAANAALTTGATGGVFLAGGIVPRFPEFLARSDFMDRFSTHPQQHDYLGAIPVSLVVAAQPGLLGAFQFLKDEAGLLTDA
jgi:glucokinase